MSEPWTQAWLYADIMADFSEQTMDFVACGHSPVRKGKIWTGGWAVHTPWDP